MLGQRFYDETGVFTANSYGQISTTSMAATATRRTSIRPANLLNAAMAGIGDGHNGGGPIWAIFDADAGARGWKPDRPTWTREGSSSRRHDRRACGEDRDASTSACPMPPDGARGDRARYNASSTPAWTRTSTSPRRPQDQAPPSTPPGRRPSSHDTARWAADQRAVPGHRLRARSSPGSIAAVSRPAASVSMVLPAPWCRVLSPAAMRWISDAPGRSPSARHIRSPIWAQSARLTAPARVGSLRRHHWRGARAVGRCRPA